MQMLALSLFATVSAVSKFYLFFLVKIIGGSKVNARPFLLMGAPYALIELLKIFGALENLKSKNNIEMSALVVTIGAEILYMVAFAGCTIIWYILFRRLFRSLISGTKINFRQRHMKILALALIVSFSLIFVFLSSRDLGILNWMMNPRKGYQFYREGYGLIFAVLITIISITQVSLFFMKQRGRSLRFFVILFMAYLTGSKEVILACLVCQLAMMSLEHTLRVRHLVVISILGAVFILINFIQAFNGVDGIYEILRYFDYYYNGSLFYNDIINGKLSFFGGEVLISNFQKTLSNILPIMPPERIGDAIITEYYYPGAIDAGHHPAFGGRLLYFADFGPIGLAFLIFSIEPIVLAFAIWLFVRPYHEYGIMSLVGVFSIVFVFSGNYGMFFPGITFLLLTFFIVHGLKIFRIK